MYVVCSGLLIQVNEDSQFNTIQRHLINSESMLQSVSQLNFAAV